MDRLYCQKLASLYERISYKRKDEVIEAGFVFHPYIDSIVCKECGWKSSGTLTLKHINVMHKINNPDCSMAKKVKENYECYDIARQCVQETESIMRDSFNSWPKFLPDVQRMVAAGLYYTGYQDDTQCISCGAVFCDWHKEDDPFLVHSEESPFCIFSSMIRK